MHFWWPQRIFLACVLTCLRLCSLAAQPATSQPDIGELSRAAPAASSSASQAKEPTMDYTVSVNGRPVQVYPCRVSAMPFNQVWPGYQRPMDQTELAAFASWDMAGPVDVEVTCTPSPAGSPSPARGDPAQPLGPVEVKPASRCIRPAVEGNRIRFRLDRPGQFTVEVGGWHHCLHLFANPPEQTPPRPDGPGVRYFGPGIHHTGPLTLASNETVYLAYGAVLYGSLQAKGASNIRIAGRGIIDVSEVARGQGHGAISLTDCSNIAIEGIIMRDPDVWCCTLSNCRGVSISGVKLVGLWRYNADGIDICNSQDVTVRDSFIRAFDDCIVLKGLSRRGVPNERPVQNVRVSRCVVWNDWGRALQIGAETSAPQISDVVFEDCDIIRTCHVAMGIQHGDRAEVRDIRYENIRVEIDAANPLPVFQTAREERYEPQLEKGYCPQLITVEVEPNYYSHDTQRGRVRNITYRRIAVTGPHIPQSIFRGADPEHDVQGIVIQDLRMNDRPAATAQDAGIEVGPNAGEVKFVDGEGKP